MAQDEISFFFPHIAVKVSNSISLRQMLFKSVFSFPYTGEMTELLFRPGKLFLIDLFFSHIDEK
jgi:hypothetical protein